MSEIVTFYSFKGGVGRSMALANTAVLLAKAEKRVLIIDWDLEAPGLDKYFSTFLLPRTSESETKGLVHLLYDLSKGGYGEDAFVDWKRHIETILIEHDNGALEIEAIFSGDHTKNYQQMVSQFSWETFFSESIDGGKKLEYWRNEILASYDFVLIDSRTGITDSGGVCTIFMPDSLIACFTANEQSLNGIEKVCRQAQSGRHRVVYDRFQLTVIPLINRWSGREEQELGALWLERIKDTLGFTMDSWVPQSVPRSTVFEQLRIPHVAKFSFGDQLLVLDHSLNDKDLPGYYYNELAQLLLSLPNLTSYWNERIPVKQRKIFSLGSIERQSHFVGREPELAELSRWFRYEGQPILTILGSAGIGKTALAAQWAYGQRNELSTIYRLDASTYESWLSSIESLYSEVVGYREEIRHDEWMAFLHKLIRLLDRRDKWLLLVDGPINNRVKSNWKECRSLFANSKGKALVIARTEDEVVGTEPRIKLDSLSLNESVALLKSIAGSELPESVAHEIVRSVGSLPLSIQLVGHYIKSDGIFQNIDLQEVLESSNVQLERVHRQAVNDLDSSTKHLLQKLACLGDYPFPSSLLRQHRLEHRRLVAVGILIELADSSAYLQTFTRSRVRDEIDNDPTERVRIAISLIQDCLSTQSQNGNDLAMWEDHIVWLIGEFRRAEVFDQNLFVLVREYAQQAFTASQITSCEVAIEAFLVVIEEFLLRLEPSYDERQRESDARETEVQYLRFGESFALTWLAKCKLAWGAVDETERLALRALRYHPTTEGDLLYRLYKEGEPTSHNAPNRAVTSPSASRDAGSEFPFEAADVLLDILIYSGQFDRAYSFGKYVFDQMAQLLSFAATEIRLIGIKIALIQAERGEVQAALTEIARFPVSISKAESPALLANRGRVCHLAGKLLEAETTLRKAIQKLEHSVSQKTMVHAALLNNLALVLKDQGHLDEAIACTSQALRIDESLVGRIHPNISTSLNNLSIMKLDAGQLDEAESLIREALEIDRSFFADDSSAVLRDQNNLAHVLASKGKVEEAVAILDLAIQNAPNTSAHKSRELLESLENLQALNNKSNLTNLIRTKVEKASEMSIEKGKQIFLSYSRTNQYIAERLHLDLKRVGLDVWWDQRSIAWGDKWKEKIQQGIDSSDYFFYLWSPEASQSEYVQWEYELAKSRKKEIRVIRIAGNESDMEDGLSSDQVINLSQDYWAGVGKVFSELGLSAPSGSMELIKQRTVAIDARKQLGDLSPREWTVYPQTSATDFKTLTFIRVPVFPKAYATSWMVTEQNEPLNLKGTFYVVFDFSGGKEDNIVQDVLNHLCEQSNGVLPQILYLEGPTNSSEQAGKDRPIYRIPDDKSYIWRDCIDLAVSAVKQIGEKREAHFFMDAPVALIFPIAAKLRELGPYKIYNLDRTASAQTYSMVFEGP